MRRAFTLPELVVVVGLVTIIIGLLSPVLVSARRRANAVSCLSNLHQIGNVAAGYENNGVRQGLPVWVLSPHDSFASLGRALLCASDPRSGDPMSSYNGNNYLAAPTRYDSLNKLPNSAAAVLVFEAYTGGGTGPGLNFPFSADTLSKEIAPTRHGDGANYLFADGHATPIPWNSIRKSIAAGHNFLDPATGL